MNVVYSEKAKQRAEDFALLQKATDFLEEILKAKAAKVQAEWDRTEDAKGQTIFTLRVSDSVDSASHSFTPEELKSSWLKFDLLRLWDDILRARGDRAFQRLLDTPV